MAAIIKLGIIPIMSEYRAKPGNEDRHGEMTGAITMRYILVMPPVMVWCIFIGPVLMGTWPTLATAILISVVLTWLSGPLSRWIWARVSHFMDHSEF
jgi:hypothetical protein